MLIRLINQDLLTDLVSKGTHFFGRKSKLFDK